MEEKIWDYTDGVTKARKERKKAGWKKPKRNAKGRTLEESKRNRRDY